MKFSLSPWIKAFKHYQNPRVFSMIFFGILSGLPFLLTLATMNVWLTEIGFSTKIIGELAFIQLPYAFRFLWSPFVDKYSIPFITKFIGKRRGWIIVSQIGLIMSIAGMSQINPIENLSLFTICGFCVSFFSATQDLVLGGYRIEVLSAEHQGNGTAALYIGYRIGLMISGAGAFYLSSLFSWETVYIIMSILLTLGLIVIIVNPEGHSIQKEKSETSYFSIIADVLKDLLKKNQWVTILIFILFYKAGDSIFGAYTSVFLSKVGFSNSDIAQGNFLGVPFSILGGFLGGILISKYGALNTFKVCGILQIITCFILIFQYYVGDYKPMIFVVAGVENFYLGIGGVTFYSFLTTLCTSGHTATQYAVLLSFGSLSRILSSWIAGWIASTVSWDYFFFITSFSGIFYIILLNRISKLSNY